MNELIVDYLEEQIESYSRQSKRLYDCHEYDIYNSRQIRNFLCVTLKQRSKYKRALKEYKKACEVYEQSKWIKSYIEEVKIEIK